MVTVSRKLDGNSLGKSGLTEDGEIESVADEDGNQKKHSKHKKHKDDKKEKKEKKHKKVLRI